MDERRDAWATELAVGAPIGPMRPRVVKLVADLGYGPWYQRSAAQLVGQMRVSRPPFLDVYDALDKRYPDLGQSCEMRYRAF